MRKTSIKQRIPEEKEKKGTRRSIQKIKPQQVFVDLLHDAPVALASACFARLP